MKKILCITLGGFFAISIALNSCKKQEIIDSGKAAMEYAYECEAVLGPLPKFSCADAIEIPSTKDGVRHN